MNTAVIEVGKKKTVKKLKQHLHVSSDIGTLRKVVVHTPDEGIERVTPNQAVELLYEDIVYLKTMQKEHRQFVKLLTAFLGTENVIDVQSLLKDILEKDDVRQELIERIGKFEDLSKKNLRKLYHLEPKQLASTLITGITPDDDHSIFSPIPNFIFTRDIGTMVNDTLLVCSAAKRARARESVLSWFVFNYHPLFRYQQKNDKLLTLFEDSEELIKGASKKKMFVEGGDVMILNHENLLIGCSERTSSKAIELMAEKLFEAHAIKRVTKIELPKVRYCTHLDTVFTQISSKDYVVFRPLIQKLNRLKITQYEAENMEGRKIRSLEDLLVDMNQQVNFIYCGHGVSPYEEREQWTDGCNLFASKSGVAVTYERNIQTIDALHENGYSVKTAAQVIKEVKDNGLTLEKIQNTIITIPSNELSRARGGAHCMTFPVWRE